MNASKALCAFSSDLAVELDERCLVRRGGSRAQMQKGALVMAR